MKLICPKCQSDRIGTLNRARKTGGTIGAAAGVTSGAAAALQGTVIGWRAATIVAPRTHPYSCIAGAIIGGLLGGVSGCAVGKTFGEAVDDSILDNHRCLACGYTFSADRHSQSVDPVQRFDDG